MLTVQNLRRARQALLLLLLILQTMQHQIECSTGLGPLQRLTESLPRMQRPRAAPRQLLESHNVPGRTLSSEGPHADALRVLLPALQTCRGHSVCARQGVRRWQGCRVQRTP